MNLKMRKSLAIKEGILRFMGRTATLPPTATAAAGLTMYPLRSASLRRNDSIAGRAMPPRGPAITAGLAQSVHRTANEARLRVYSRPAVLGISLFVKSWR